MVVLALAWPAAMGALVGARAIVAGELWAGISDSNDPSGTAGSFAAMASGLVPSAARGSVTSAAGTARADGSTADNDAAATEGGFGALLPGGAAPGATRGTAGVATTRSSRALRGLSACNRINW